MMVPIEAPLAFSGFTDRHAARVRPDVPADGNRRWCRAARAGDLHTNQPAPGWEHSLNPGESVAGVLVDGDWTRHRPGHGYL